MKIEGIVLYTVDFKEASSIVYLYTSKGILSIKALKAKKMNSGLLSFITTGNIVSCEITDKEFPTLIQYSLEKSSYDLLNNIFSLKALSIIIKVLRTIKDEKQELVYPFVKNIISSLNTNPLKLLTIFLIKMTYPLGIAPNLKECYKCKRKPDFIILNEGYSLCKNCYNGDITNNNYDTWYEYYTKKNEFINYTDYEDYNKILEELFYYYKVHLDLELKL